MQYAINAFNAVIVCSSGVGYLHSIDSIDQRGIALLRLIGEIGQIDPEQLHGGDGVPGR
jgi:hypothetical protein